VAGTCESGNKLSWFHKMREISSLAVNSLATQEGSVPWSKYVSYIRNVSNFRIGFGNGVLQVSNTQEFKGTKQRNNIRNVHTHTYMYTMCVYICILCVCVCTLCIL
jgi:hypothetical protein